VGTLAFRVADAQRAFTLLDGRGATPISDVETHKDEGGTLKTFSITTPFGDTTFRFVERRGYRAFFPGFSEVPRARAGQNLCTITGVDHITSNFQTMSPALLWMEHVLGFERYWDVEFHTRDVGRVKMRDGSGLRSVVMWDRTSGLKFANNEPYRPNFKGSQRGARKLWLVASWSATNFRSRTSYSCRSFTRRVVWACRSKPTQRCCASKPNA
jgi:4-hydroxyphenylpyruvate dioxygenase